MGIEGGKDPLEGFDWRVLVDNLDQHLIRGGSLKDLLGKDPLSVYGCISDATDRRSVAIEQIVSYLDRTGVRREPSDQALKYIPMGCESQKGLMSMRLKQGNASADDIAMVESITLEDVAFYAHRQYRELTSKLLTLPCDSSEHRQTLVKAAFWSEIDERISLAAFPRS